jgi:hypothetical protein
MIISRLIANCVKIACRIIRSQILPGTSAAWWVAGGKPPSKLGTASWRWRGPKLDVGQCRLKAGTPPSLRATSPFRGGF